MIRPATLSALVVLASPGAMARQNALSGNAAPPMIVTSDTDAYCETLTRQIEMHEGALPPSVQALRAEGARLCATGQVRGGINRLRRALLVLNEPDDASSTEVETIQR